MATQYSKITPTAYNNARTQVVGVLGITTTGEVGATQGYGQTPVSSAVSQYEKINETHLDNLRSDIVQAYTHQNGTAPTITNVALGDTALASLFTEYESLASGINTNKDTVNSGQLASVTYTQTESYTAYTGTVPPDGRGWKNYAYYEFKITFTDADKARYFFNAGGTFNFTASREGGTVAPSIGLTQNVVWTDLLAAVTLEAPSFSKTNFYALTDAYSTGFYTKNSTTAGYTANYYRLSAKSNVADNSLGGATDITFKIEFVDAYNFGNDTNYDAVDGTFTSTIVRKMPKGAGAGGAVSVSAPSAPTVTPSSGLSENGEPIYITAAYTISANKSTINENSVVSGDRTINFTFNATNYFVPNTVTWKIKASTTTSLVDFDETGWTASTDVDGYKLLTRTTTTTGNYANSTTSTSITSNSDQLTEGLETFTVTATGTADGSGGGFPSPPVTFTITDNSKTPTPGFTFSEPTASPQLSCIPGEGLGATNTWYITSLPFTSTPDLIIYGIYLDISGYGDVSAYRMVLWDGTVITQSQSTYYTLPTPKSVAANNNVSFTVQVGTTSGTPGTGTVRIRLRTNAGTEDGSGPNVTSPTYNQSSLAVSVTVTTPTINLVLSPSPSSISYYYVGTSTGQQSTTLTVSNTGNARATISNYSVGTPGSSVDKGNLVGTVILAGGSTTDTITYSSNYAVDGTSTVSVTATNPNISSTTKTRDITVHAELAYPILSASFASSSVSSEVYTDVSVNITFSNTGYAPLTISSVTGSGTFVSGRRTGAAVTTVAARSSQTTTYVFSRSRIGSSINTITIVSNDPAGNKTTSITVIGTRRVPTFKLTSGLLGVTTTSLTDNLGRLAKDSTVKVEFYNMEPNTTFGCWLFWTEGQDAYTNGGYGCHGTYPTETDPKLLTPGNSTDSSGYGAAWDGTGGAQETKYWRAGRNRFYIQLPVGQTDDGTRQWFTNSRSSTSGAGSSSGWATYTSSPEAACGANQSWIGFKVVPNVTWSLSNYSPVQGDTVTLTASGMASDAYCYLNTTLFQDRPGSPSGPNQSVLSTTLVPISNTNGEVSVNYYVDKPIGTYSTSRVISYGGSSIYLDGLSIGEIRSIDILSPNWYYAEDASGGEPYHGYAVSPFVTNGWDGFWSGGPAGVWYFYRRSFSSNGTKNFSMWIDADDLLKVYAQGILLAQGQLGTPTVTDVSINVTDGYIHWIFEYTNTASISWMSMILFVSPYPLNRTVANTDWTTGRAGSLRDLPGPSRW